MPPWQLVAVLAVPLAGLTIHPLSLSTRQAVEGDTVELACTVTVQPALLSELDIKAHMTITVNTFAALAHCAKI